MDAYQILGLTRGASKTEAKKAYRNLALKEHPDKNGNTRAATVRFQRILDAYEQIMSGNIREPSAPEPEPAPEPTETPAAKPEPEMTPYCPDDMHNDLSFPGRGSSRDRNAFFTHGQFANVDGHTCPHANAHDIPATESARERELKRFSKLGLFDQRMHIVRKIIKVRDRILEHHILHTSRVDGLFGVEESIQDFLPLFVYAKGKGGLGECFTHFGKLLFLMAVLHLRYYGHPEKDIFVEGLFERTAESLGISHLIQTYGSYILSLAQEGFTRASQAMRLEMQPNVPSDEPPKSGPVPHTHAAQDAGDAVSLQLCHCHYGHCCHCQEMKCCGYIH